MRFGVIQTATDNSLPVFVPEACAEMRVYFDFAGFDISKLVEGDSCWRKSQAGWERLHMGPVAALDANGNALLVVEHGVCRRFGE